MLLGLAGQLMQLQLSLVGNFSNFFSYFVFLHELARGFLPKKMVKKQGW
jgi:hypothetical protein